MSLIWKDDEWSTEPILVPATDVTVTDAGGHFTSTDVEGALTELGEAPENLKWKEPVRVALSTWDEPLSGLSTEDGVTLLGGDRVLVYERQDPSATGIYIASSGAWTRSPDADTEEKRTGIAVLVLEGTANAGKTFRTSTSSSLIWTGRTVPAADVVVADAGGYFTGSNVEAALQELGGAESGPSAPITDTAANLAATNPVADPGQIVRATDTDQVAFGDGATAWNDLPKYEPNVAGQVLDIATTTVAQTGIVTAPVDLIGLSITFDVTTRPVEVELHLPFVYGNPANIPGRASICDGDGTELRSTLMYPSAINAPEVIVIKEQITAPGTYTRKARFGRNGGSGTFANGIDLAQYTSQIKATVQ